MSASDEWTEYHLTPNGWISGSSKYDFGSENKVDEPPDRVLTCRFRATMSSGFSNKIDKSVTEIWRSNDANVVAMLVKKYGNCPNKLS